MDCGKTIRANIEITVGGRPLSLAMELPDRQVSLRELLPLIQIIDHKIIDVAVREANDKGEMVRCSKGCGACCKQLVPITQTEAWHISHVVNTLPKQKQKRIKQAYIDAEQLIKQGGLWEVLSNTAEIENMREIGFDYFDLGIDCPFLENDACSIHPVRPLSCREFLATSPPKECSQPREMKIRSVDIPTRISNVLSRVETDKKEGTFEWVPLSMALSWAGGHQEPPKMASTVWMEKFFNTLSGR